MHARSSLYCCLCQLSHSVVNDRHRDDLHEHRLIDAHRERRESNLASIGMETS